MDEIDPSMHARISGPDEAREFLAEAGPVFDEYVEMLQEEARQDRITRIGLGVIFGATTLCLAALSLISKNDVSQFIEKITK